MNEQTTNERHAEATGFKFNERVMRTRDRATGTVIGFHEEPARPGAGVEGSVVSVRCDWDMLYGESIESPDELEHDAPMPDPAFALAKALRYRHQRDRALEDIAKLAGLEVDYRRRIVGLEVALEDARQEYGLAVARVSKHLGEVEQRNRELERAAIEAALIIGDEEGQVPRERWLSVFEGLIRDTPGNASS